MAQRDWKRTVDLVLLTAATLTFGSGLVLLFAFHAGDGPSRVSALGVGRLAWLDLHRVSALLSVSGIAFHAGHHWRPLVARWKRPFAGRGTGLELLLYATAAVTSITGLVAWLVLDGSAPLGGPIPPGRLPPLRHGWVDIHDVAGLLALALTAHHVGHRWRRLVRPPRPRPRTEATPGDRKCTAGD